MSYFNWSAAVDRTNSVFTVGIEYSVTPFSDPLGEVNWETEWTLTYYDQSYANLLDGWSGGHFDPFVTFAHGTTLDTAPGIAVNNLDFEVVNPFSLHQIIYYWRVIDAALETAAQTISGTAFSDIALGGAGDDVIATAGADDFVDAGGGSDTVDGGAGDDTLRGLAGEDTLFGGIGKDELDGGEGADSMIGGKGDDTYFVDDAGDEVFELPNQGEDSVRTSVSFSLAGSHADHLFLLGTAAINGTGNQLVNLIIGNTADNIIDGGGGGDVMQGGAGSDTYHVDNAGDVVTEANVSGVDTVNASVSFSLSGQNIERLVLTGTADINGAGNSLANRLTGNAGDNVLNGRTGADRMIGLGGDDTYHVDNAGDIVEEANVAGVDTVNSSVSFNLAGQHIERLVLTGTAAIDGTGNSLANSITGNSVNNVLNGSTGSDILTGNGGVDVFRFNTALGASNVDTITDFQIDTDKIELENNIFAEVGGDLSASEFVANATGTATTGAQKILYDTANGRLYYDADGNGVGARVHFATLSAGLALDHLDFQVI